MVGVIRHSIYDPTAGDQPSAGCTAPACIVAVRVPQLCLQRAPTGVGYDLSKTVKLSTSLGTSLIVYISGGNDCHTAQNQRIHHQKSWQYMIAKTALRKHGQKMACPRTTNIAPTRAATKG